MFCMLKKRKKKYIVFLFQNITKMVRQFQKKKVAIALNVLYATKRKKYLLLMFQNITQMV